jgi:protein SCO1/2
MIRAARIFAVAALVVVPAVRAQDAVAPPDIAQTRGRPVPDVELVAEDSTTYRFAILQGRPVIVSPIFTSCPHTCSFITASLRDALAGIGEPGVGYEVITLSFDPADGPAELRAYRERHQLPAGWRLAVATPENLAALLAAIDFQYQAMEGGGFAHANVIAIIDPELKVASYLHGVTFESAAVRRALEEAVGGTSLVRKARPLIVALGALGLLATAVAIIATGRRRREA